jgi:H+/gluconate symporter-like permease
MIYELSTADLTKLLNAAQGKLYLRVLLCLLGSSDFKYYLFIYLFICSFILGLFNDIATAQTIVYLRMIK